MRNTKRSDATQNSRDVSIEYFNMEEFGGTHKWVIFTNDISPVVVKSYNREADASADYAALRNGEVTIAEVQAS